MKRLPLDTVSTRIREKETLSLPLINTDARTRTHSKTNATHIFEELSQRGQLIKWRYSEEQRIKAFSEMTLLRIPPRAASPHSLLCSLSPSFSPSPDACLLLCLAPGRERRGGYGCNPQPASVSTKLILFKPQRINPSPCAGC